MRWEPGSGRGEVHTYTVAYHPYDRTMIDKVPYAIAVVRLDEGPFYHSDIVGCPAAEVHIGMRVRVVYDALDADTVIPRFTPEKGTHDDPSA
jgi:uncharacterized protein